MTIINHWLNGRSLEWIAKHENVPPQTVVDVIRKEWSYNAKRTSD